MGYIYPLETVLLCIIYGMQNHDRSGELIDAFDSHLYGMGDGFKVAARYGW